MSSKDWRKDGVLIVGGGIAGLALAGSLHRQGVPCELVERTHTWAPVGAGIVLGINAMKVLRELGLAEALEGKARTLEAMSITDADNRLLARTNLMDLEPRFGTSLALHRSALHDALLETARHVPIRMGTTVESAEEHEDSVVVRFNSGDTARFGLMVGADGLHSQVRELAFGPLPLRYSGYTCWRTVVAEGGSELGGQEMWGVGKRFGLVPLDGDRVYCFAVINAPPEDPDPAEVRIDRIRREFSEFRGPVPDLLSQLRRPEELIKNDLHEIVHRPWHRGHVLLVGDAAHGMTPDMGQGAAMALEDVWVLSQFIASELPLEKVLTNWMNRRKRRVRWVQNQSRRIGWVGQWSHPLPCRVRNELTRLLPDSATTRVLARLAQRLA
jgi:2-polyprenyl-6-methoxyphenol hydroxylase-like FAD-dependent oxidoreductase